MSESTLPLPGLSPVGGKRVVARFDGGEMSSDGGVLLLREVERRLGIADRLARCIVERRGPARVRHAMADSRYGVHAVPVRWKAKDFGGRCWVRRP